MKEHYPKLCLELAHSTDDVPDGKFEAYIHYARNRESREDVDPRAAGGSNWICPTVSTCDSHTYHFPDGLQCDFSNYSTRLKCKICGGPQGGESLSSTNQLLANDMVPKFQTGNKTLLA